MPRLRTVAAVTALTVAGITLGACSSATDQTLDTATAPTTAAPVATSPDLTIADLPDDGQQGRYCEGLIEGIARSWDRGGSDAGDRLAELETGRLELLEAAPSGIVETLTRVLDHRQSELTVLARSGAPTSAGGEYPLGLSPEAARNVLHDHATLALFEASYCAEPGTEQPATLPNDVPITFTTKSASGSTVEVPTDQTLYDLGIRAGEAFVQGGHAALIELSDTPECRALLEDEVVIAYADHLRATHVEGTAAGLAYHPELGEDGRLAIESTTATADSKRSTTLGLDLVRDEGRWGIEINLGANTGCVLWA